MADSVTQGALPYPIANARYSLAITFRVSAGTPTDPTSPDTELSSDGGATFADCTEEITTGGGNGAGYITLTGAETNNSMVILAAKSSNCVTTPVVLSPRVLAIVGSGTLSAGSAGGGTLGTLLAYDVTGCFVRTTGGTGGGGTGGASNQARKVITYVTTTGAFTVSPNWETTPDNTTTYDVLLPEGVTLGMLRTLNPTVAGKTLDVSTGGEAGIDWANVGSPTTTLALSGTTVGISTALTNLPTIPNNWLTAAGIAADAITAAKIADGAIDAATFATGAITAASIAADAITAAKIADGAIDAATFAANALDAVWSTATRLLTAGTNIVLPSNGLGSITAWTVAITGNITGNLSGSVGSVTGAVGSVTGAVGSVTGAVGSVTGNVGGNVTGSVGSVVTKTGFILAATGLDAITATTPSGVATTIPQMIVQLFRYEFAPSEYDSVGHTIKTFADNGITVITTQTATVAAGVQTRGLAA